MRFKLSAPTGHGTIPLERHPVLSVHPTTPPRSEGLSGKSTMCLTVSIRRGSSEVKVGMVALKLYVSRPERPKPLPCPTPKGWEQRLAREALGMALEGQLVPMDCVTLLFLPFPGHSPSAHLWPRSVGGSRRSWV